MGRKNAGGRCPYCGKKLAYITRRCGGCGRNLDSSEMIKIGSAMLKEGSSVRRVRRQIAEAGRGMGNDILKSVSQLYTDDDVYLSAFSLMIGRDFGDPMVFSEEILESRYPHSPQALRVEIAQTLLAMNTEKSKRAIAELKRIETDQTCLRAFEEPFVSSDGLSYASDTSVEGGSEDTSKEAMKGGEVGGKASQGQGVASTTVQEDSVVETDDDGTLAGEDDVQVSRMEEEGGDEKAEDDGQEASRAEDEQEGGRATATLPPPLPVDEKIVSGEGKGLVVDVSTMGRGRQQKRNYVSFGVVTIGIALFGALIGYAVAKWGERRGREVGKGAAGEVFRDNHGVGEKTTSIREKTKVEGGENQSSAFSGDTPLVKGEVESHILKAKIVEASSFHRKFPPGNVMDGDPATVWQEDKNRKPIGEWLKIDFGEEVTVTKVGIVGGYDYVDEKGKDYFPLNCRLKEAEFIFSDGSSRKVSFEDRRAIQYELIEPPVKTSWIRITVFEVYKGSWFFDNAIGEVEVWGYEESQLESKPAIGAAQNG